MFNHFYDQDFVSSYEFNPLAYLNFGSSTQMPSSIDVFLTFVPSNEREMIPNVPITYCEDGGINLLSLINRLKEDGFPIANSMIYYYSPSSDIYYYCGKDPNPSCTSVPHEAIAQEGTQRFVTLRIRADKNTVPLTNRQLYNYVYEADSKTEAKSESDKYSLEEEGTGLSKFQKKPRHKERYLGEVLDLVLKWRKLYEGSVDPTTGKFIKLNLNQAAGQLDVSRKSLDDYLLVIKQAKALGFDFQANKFERFGVVRNFVKNHKKHAIKAEKNSQPGDDYEVEDQVPKNKNSKKIRKGALSR